jgi:hypothetical protein
MNTTCVAIFDDLALVDSHAALLRSEMPGTVTAYGATEELVFEKRWNATADGLRNPASRIRGEDEFRDALSWAKSYAGRAICFVDVHLKGVPVTSKDCEAVNELAQQLTKAPTAEAAAQIYSSGAQGLLLALVLSQNPSADVDICIASGVTTGVDEAVEFLRQHAKPDVFIDSGNTLTRFGSPEKTLEAIKQAIVRFEARRRIDRPEESIYWPEEARSWFVGDEHAQAPHNHHVFVGRPEEDKAALQGYLQGIGAPADLARRWLEEAFFVYESLKQFVGSSAKVHAGPDALSIGSLLFPLLTATKGKGWAEQLTFPPATRAPILAPDKAKSRQLIFSLLRLFQAMTVTKFKGGPENQVYAEFREKKDGLHFFVEFSADGSMGFTQEGQAKASEVPLCAKILAFPWVKASGDFSKPTYDILKLLHSDQTKPNLLLSIYPIEKEDGSTWTRCDFKVRES